MTDDTRPQWDDLWTNVHLATLAPGTGYGEIRNGAIAVKDGRIAWLGPHANLPSKAEVEREHNGQNCWLTPGLIDCHTHIVYAGNRSNEFEARLNGVPYEEIARQGGGIISTVKATRAATEEALLKSSLPRVQALLNEGVTTLEIKSGYGLDIATESKMLRVARKISALLPVRVKTTFLGAHALPPEYKGRADDYIDLVCSEMLDTLVGEELVDAVDAFCENIGFTRAQTERVFRAAQKHKLPVKLHAEQLSDQDGSSLTAQYNGLSADHLEYLSSNGVRAMAQAGTVAVLLPGAFYYLRETRLPPIEVLRQHGVPIAISTDCNPGTSPLTSILLTMNMACTLFRLTPLEALTGVTRHAAQALGLQHETGSLQPGYWADFSLWDIDRPGDLAYAIGFNPHCATVFKGRVVDKNYRQN